MALHVIQGLMGAGKSYVAVNKILTEYLRETDRPIYTNLPVNLDELAAWVNPKPSTWEATKARVNLLDNVEKECFDAEGASLGKRHQLKEFWRFTVPNAVILLDESADVFNSQAWKERPEELTSYINHHRHYKDDLYFFAQDRDDLDVQIRRKIQYVWLIRNSMTENISEAPLLAGMKWPVQFFMVSCFLGPDVLGKPSNQTKIKPMHGFSVWPKPQGFRTYESFSSSQSLPGKMTAAKDAKSGDYGRTVKSQWAVFFGRVPMFGIMILVGLGAVGGAFYVGIKLMGKTKTSVGASRHSAQVAETNAIVALEAAENGGTNSVKGANEITVAGERLVFSGPSYVRTDKRTYRIGDAIGERRIDRIFADGVRFAGGGYEFFDVLFPGR